jgi:hypothetical protein
MPNDAATLPALIPQQRLATGETAASSVAAQSKALVEARYIIAMRKPRVWDQVRQDILRECRRPSFAHNKSAWYKKPIGKGVEGLGIRFVEVALRCMTNVLIETTMIYEDEQKEVQRVSVTDLEANVTYPLDVRVSKTVERSKPMDDGTYFSVRLNSENRKVYTVIATDDELLNKRAALISKAIRTLGLRIVPGDIQDEAEQIIKETRLNDAAADPDSERKRIADGFAEINVRASDLVEYLGHALEACSPPELVGLRGLYGAIRDGETTWTAVMDNKREQDGGGDKANPLAKFNRERKTTPPAPVTTSVQVTVEPEPGPGEPSVTLGGPPVVTAPAVEAKLVAAANAGDLDLLETHASLIGEIADGVTREAVTKVYKKLRADLRTKLKLD